MVLLTMCRISFCVVAGTFAHERPNFSRCKQCQEPQLPTNAKYNTSLDFVKLHPFIRQHLAHLAHLSPLANLAHAAPARLRSIQCQASFPMNNHVTAVQESLSIVLRPTTRHRPICC
ncbi:hypothetical protein OCU04_012717 [Sclerotinia nivalis]|uniref:Secreted protein n=1 Tax=Sclerotinia nivalis TaxID=352851 RepID=A0A9X0A995_9HELO|nr:hypothetical protein OCU04_012717 [Sclerotinia nivalis]